MPASSAAAPAATAPAAAAAAEAASAAAGTSEWLQVLEHACAITDLLTIATPDPQHVPMLADLISVATDALRRCVSVGEAVNVAGASRADPGVASTAAPEVASTAAEVASTAAPGVASTAAPGVAGAADAAPGLEGLDWGEAEEEVLEVAADPATTREHSPTGFAGTAAGEGAPGPSSAPGPSRGPTPPRVKRKRERAAMHQLRSSD